MPPAWSWAVLALVAAVAVQRVLELRLARRNARALVARGARLVSADGYGLIVTVHVLWFGMLVAEWFLAPWSRVGWFTLPFLALFLAGQALRYWAIRSLGARWTTRVIVLPGAPRVARGPYKWLNHPNYVAVVLELAALPLAFGAFGTAAVATVANALALARRVSVENAALRDATHASAPARTDAA